MDEENGRIKFPDQLIEGLVFETFGLRRFTQDSPIRPDVWLRFLKLAKWRLIAPSAEKQADYKSIALKHRVPLILTPKLTMERDGRPSGHTGQLMLRIRNSFLAGKAAKSDDDAEELRDLRLAATTRHVALDVTFEELILHILPMTDWWRHYRPAVVLKDIEDKFVAERDRNRSIAEILSELDNTESYRFAALTSILMLLLNQDGLTQKDIDVIAATLAPSCLANNRMDEFEKLNDELFPNAQPTQQRGDRSAQIDLIRRLSGMYKTILSAQDNMGGHSQLAKERQEEVERATIWSIHLNRPTIRQTIAPTKAQSDGFNSSKIVKADAARRLFNVSTSNLIWAIVDTGIDATHKAFELIGDDYDPAAPSKHSRVVETLDFTCLQDLQSSSEEVLQAATERLAGKNATDEVKQKKRKEVNALSNQLRKYAQEGAQVDWSLIEKLIRYEPMEAEAPADPHGTHVAGILGGHIPALDKRAKTSSDLAADSKTSTVDQIGPFEGVCPDIKLYDLRVLGKSKRFSALGNEDDSSKTFVAGSDEFTILAALDYIAWKNRDPMMPTIHGVNVSLAIPFEVGSHACGRTPVCDACDRLVWSGTVVVAAAGNSGYDDEHRHAAFGVGYQYMSITDPGNAHEVITVGSTHYKEPHTYGVSYFSSRGPTGDGRNKPDILAPGEKIRSTVPSNQMLVMDGTSMAAPHISGVCALLMGRHTELIGEPEKIKKILMETATDLGRDRNMQGAGLVDALRALQSV